MKFHINYLQNDLMEKNFLKIIEPYSVVEIQFIAAKMELPEVEVIHRRMCWVVDHSEVIADDLG